MKHLPIIAACALVVGIGALFVFGASQPAHAAQIPANVLDNGNQACGGYDYQARPVIDGSYSCPEEYDGPNAQNECTKLISEEQTSCPASYLWSYTYKGVTYTSIVSYDKKDNDPNHCHRQSDNIEPSGDVPGAVRGKFNQDNPEKKDATIIPAVYDTIPATLSSGTYGDCPNGWEVNPNDEAQCRQAQDPCPPGTTTICYEGKTIVVNTDNLNDYPGYTDGACSQPPAHHGNSCNTYAAMLERVGHLDRLDAIKKCASGGIGEWLQNIAAWVYQNLPISR